MAMHAHNDDVSRALRFSTSRALHSTENPTQHHSGVHTESTMESGGTRSRPSLLRQPIANTSFSSISSSHTSAHTDSEVSVSDIGQIFQEKIRMLRASIQQQRLQHERELQKDLEHEREQHNAPQPPPRADPPVFGAHQTVGAPIEPIASLFLSNSPPPAWRPLQTPSTSPQSARSTTASPAVVVVEATPLALGHSNTPPSPTRRDASTMTERTSPPPRKRRGAGMDRQSGQTAHTLRAPSESTGSCRSSRPHSSVPSEAEMDAANRLGERSLDRLLRGAKTSSRVLLLDPRGVSASGARLISARPSRSPSPTCEDTQMSTAPTLRSHSVRATAELTVAEKRQRDLLREMQRIDDELERMERMPWSKSLRTGDYASTSLSMEKSRLVRLRRRYEAELAQAHSDPHAQTAPPPMRGTRKAEVSNSTRSVRPASTSRPKSTTRPISAPRAASTSTRSSSLIAHPVRINSSIRPQTTRKGGMETSKKNFSVRPHMEPPSLPRRGPSAYESVLHEKSERHVRRQATQVHRRSVSLDAERMAAFYASQTAARRTSHTTPISTSAATPSASVPPSEEGDAPLYWRMAESRRAEETTSTASNLSLHSATAPSVPQDAWHEAELFADMPAEQYYCAEFGEEEEENGWRSGESQRGMRQRPHYDEQLQQQQRQQKRHPHQGHITPQQRPYSSRKASSTMHRSASSGSGLCYSLSAPSRRGTAPTLCFRPDKTNKATLSTPPPPVAAVVVGGEKGIRRTSSLRHTLPTSHMEVAPKRLESCEPLRACLRNDENGRRLDSHPRRHISYEEYTPPLSHLSAKQRHPLWADDGMHIHANSRHANPTDTDSMKMTYERETMQHQHPSKVCSAPINALQGTPTPRQRQRRQDGPGPVPTASFSASSPYSEVRVSPLTEGSGESPYAPSPPTQRTTTPPPSSKTTSFSQQPRRVGGDRTNLPFSDVHASAGQEKARLGTDALSLRQLFGRDGTIPTFPSTSSENGVSSTDLLLERIKRMRMQMK